MKRAFSTEEKFDAYQCSNPDCGQTIMVFTFVDRKDDTSGEEYTQVFNPSRHMYCPMCGKKAKE